MSMMTNAYLITNFVQYQSYFIDANGDYDADILTNEIAQAEIKLNEYVTVDETSLTDQLKLHLLNIVKYRGFVRKHGDTEFTEKPQIVKDYEDTIKILEELKGGERGMTARGVTTSDAVTMTSKSRIFGNDDGTRDWFN